MTSTDHGTRQSCRCPPDGLDDSGIFSYEARHYAQPASTGHHLELLRQIAVLTAAASCSARRDSQTRATTQHALLLVGSSGARLSAGAKAARDDCGGFLFGSAVLADAGDHAARAAAGRFFGRAALRRRQGCPR